MAVMFTSSLRRASVIALAVGALSLPAIAQAEPEDRPSWQERVERKDAPQAQTEVRAASQSRWNGGEGRRSGDEGRRRGWSSQTAESQAARPQQETTQSPKNWRDRVGRTDDGERRVRNETWHSSDGRAGTWQAQTTEAERVAPQSTTRTGTDWRSRVQRSDYDRTRDRDYWRKRDWNNHWDRSRRGNWSGWNNQWNWTWANDYRRWNTHWRSSSRYDWYGWRNRYPSYFQVGTYYSPYRNYSYRRLSIGYFLDNLFFDQDYWIADPGYYHLPEAYGPYRWVRYYDDAVLVNIYDGEVIDVIYSFFW